MEVSIKSVTDSKKLVQVLNRFGHFLNYSCLASLEITTAEAIKERKLACPEDTVVWLRIGFAFENFDKMTQTLSGSYTMHDTMGVLCQNAPADNTNIQPTQETQREAVDTATSTVVCKSLGTLKENSQMCIFY